VRCSRRVALASVGKGSGDKADAADEGPCKLTCHAKGITDRVRAASTSLAKAEVKLSQHGRDGGGERAT